MLCLTEHWGFVLHPRTPPSRQLEPLGWRPSSGLAGASLLLLLRVAPAGSLPDPALRCGRAWPGHGEQGVVGRAWSA